MLCWICPECGRDCSPAVRECPSCAQRKSGITGVTNGVLSMVESFRKIPSVPLLAAAPQQYLLFGLTNGRSSTTVEAAVETEEHPIIPAGETIDSLVRPLVESAKVSPPVESAPEDVAADNTRPEIALAKLEQSEVAGIERAEITPLEVASVDAAPSELPQSIELLNLSAAEPLPAPLEPVHLPDIEPTAATPAPMLKPAAPSAPVKYVELAAPLSPPVRTAPLIDSSNPAAAQLASEAPLSEAQPTDFRAPKTKLAQLAKQATSPAKSAPRVEARTMPNPEAPAALSLRVAEPSVPPAPDLKLAELSVPPKPPAKTAGHVPSARPAMAQLPPRSAAQPPQPMPFFSRTLEIRQFKARADSSVRTAPPVPSRKPASAPMPDATRSVIECEAFAERPVCVPRYFPAAERVWAATSLADQSRSISQAFALQTAALLDEITAQADVYEGKIRAIAATFQAQPRFFLLSAATNIVAPPAPPDLQWLKTPRPKIPTSKPADPQCKSITTPPQKLPLAGPCLPPELQNYLEPPLADFSRKRNRIGMPAWIVSLVLATSLFLVAGTGLQYFMTNHTAKTAAAAPPASHPAVTAPVVPSFEQHPFARFVEVTGLRVVADLNHRSQVQYIVVNHSASPLTGMLIKIAVRSSTAPAGSEPLFTVSAVVPSLGPHQSKEIRTDLDSELRTSAIPDWEYLRTDVQVGTQN